MRTLLEIEEAIYYNDFNGWKNMSTPDDINQHIVWRNKVKREADNYVEELLSHNNRCKSILENDLKEICVFAESSRKFGTENFSGEMPDVFKEHDSLICDFITEIRKSLKRYGYEYQKELSPQALLALHYCQWFSDEESLKWMKDFVINRVGSIDDVELFPDEGNEQPEQTALDKLLEEWNTPGITQRVLILLEKNGLATKNGKVYNWKIDNDNDYTNNLYVYFVYIASDKFGWRLRKNKDRIPWNKFNPLFPNMANNQNALNQYLIEIKNGIFPRRATEIDDIVK